MQTVDHFPSVITYFFSQTSFNRNELFALKIVVTTSTALRIGWREIQIVITIVSLFGAVVAFIFLVDWRPDTYLISKDKCLVAIFLRGILYKMVPTAQQ